MCLRKDRRTPNPMSREYRNYPMVDEYKYLGVMIDNCLNLKSEMHKKKQMEISLKSSMNRLSYTKLDKAAKYHVWQALFKSRVWYSIILTTRLNAQMKKWTQSFLYRSLKQITGLKGNPNTEKLYNCVFLMDQQHTIEALWAQAISRKLLKEDITNRRDIANKYDLDVNINIDDKTL